MEFLRRVQQFFREVVAEFKKVNWPGRVQVANSTVVVLVVVGVIGFFLFLVDIGLSRVVGVILR
ncbi:MAG: preprotein translocase subunit SecE [Candidatus Rokubacteria bacterium]|nr:preprotein translocase subunit SecE [Candidatus Rokubacteria bacterium]